jgi:CheY-like chemotaxis protein
MNCICRVLIVEDETIVAMLLEKALLGLGYAVVDCVQTLETALVSAKNAIFDIAVLDANLNGKFSLPVAEVLQARRIPFVLATGYSTSELEQAFPDVPLLRKPFKIAALVQVITQLGASVAAAQMQTQTQMLMQPQPPEMSAIDGVRMQMPKAASVA